MKTVAVRELRQHWPAVEAALAREGELFVTRDGVRVARLVRVEVTKARRARFSAQEHLAWLRKSYGRRATRVVDALLERDRADG